MHSNPDLGDTVRWQGGLYVLIGRYRPSGDSSWMRAKIRPVHHESEGVVTTAATASEDAEVPYGELTKARKAKELEEAES